MGLYRKASHTTYDCRYHIVWITKYRRKVLNKGMQERLKELLEVFALDLYVKIIRLGKEEDHVHMYVSVPVSCWIPDVVQQFKGGSSKILGEEFSEHLKKFYWKKKALWAVGYFVATVGEVNDEVIKRYVEQQGREEVLGKEIEL